MVSTFTLDFAPFFGKLVWGFDAETTWCGNDKYENHKLVYKWQQKEVCSWIGLQYQHLLAKMGPNFSREGTLALEDDKLINAPTYIYDEVMQLLKLASVIEHK